MGLEEHLLHMFRDDFEFHDDAGASHHGGHAPKPIQAQDQTQDTTKEQGVEDPVAMADAVAKTQQDGNIVWLSSAEKELKKIPFFVRGKARRNTESYAAEKGLGEISLDTLYEAKAHYAR